MPHREMNMQRYEFENKVSDEDYRKAKLVLMNVEAVIRTGKTADILKTCGVEVIEILYLLVEDRGKLIDEVGDLKAEVASLLKENRKLREFKELIIKAAKEE